MSTRVVIRGRTRWASKDYRPSKMPEKINPLPVEYKQPQPITVGAPFWDEDDEIYYRVVLRLDPQEGWCLAEQLMKLYGVAYPCIIDWAKRGLVDPAIEKGSPTRRFRVRNHEELLVKAGQWREKYKRRGKRKS